MTRMGEKNESLSDLDRSRFNKKRESDSCHLLIRDIRVLRLDPSLFATLDGTTLLGSCLTILVVYPSICVTPAVWAAVAGTDCRPGRAAAATAERRAGSVVFPGCSRTNYPEGVPAVLEGGPAAVPGSSLVVDPDGSPVDSLAVATAGPGSPPGDAAGSTRHGVGGWPSFCFWDQ